MKFTINVDCTPAEAREFIGLPNVAPMQDRLVEELEQRIHRDIKRLDPETLMRTWLPTNVKSLSEMQKCFGSKWVPRNLSQRAESRVLHLPRHAQ